MALYGVPYGGASCRTGCFGRFKRNGCWRRASAPFMCVYLHSAIKGYADSINEALINADFTSAISKAMKGRINKTFIKGKCTKYED